MSALKSPALLFVVLGIVASFLYVHFKPLDRDTILVTTQTIDELRKNYEIILE